MARLDAPPREGQRSLLLREPLPPDDARRLIRQVLDGGHRGGRMEGVMQCMQCGDKMQTGREDRPHLDLPAIMLRGVEVRRCPKCDEEEIVIPRLDELHRTIAAVLLVKRARLSPAEIRFLRKAAEWGEAELAGVLDVAPEMVSRWEDGTEQPNGSIDRLIRTLIAARLGMPLSFDAVSRIGDTNEPLSVTLRFGPAGWVAVAVRAMLDSISPEEA